MNESRLIPKFSFKSALIFCAILFSGMLLLTKPISLLGFSKTVSYFLSAGISASTGLALILTKIDAKPEDRPYFKKRIFISIIVGFAASALITFVFGGDVIG